MVEVIYDRFDHTRPSLITTQNYFNKTMDFRQDVAIFFLHENNLKMTLVSNKLYMQRTIAEWLAMKQAGLRHFAV